MSSTDVRYPAAEGRASPPIVTPHYGSSLPNAANDIESARNTRCATGVRFIQTLYGILNIVIIIAIVCILICAGVANRNNCKAVDDLGTDSNAKVSAYNTRNAVLAFAVIGLILILADTILHITKLINRLPSGFDLIFIIVMLVLGGIYLILGCCAAAWEKKMHDAEAFGVAYVHSGSAGAAAFFLFAAMFAVIIDFALRLIRPTARVAS